MTKQEQKEIIQEGLDCKNNPNIIMQLPDNDWLWGDMDFIEGKFIIDCYLDQEDIQIINKHKTGIDLFLKKYENENQNEYKDNIKKLKKSIKILSK